MTTRTALLLLLGIGAILLFLNREQPLVRNSLVYARAAEHVIAHHYNAMAVVADSRLSYDKPIGFAWLASPLVAALGNHLGLMVASALGTLAWVVALCRFARRIDPLALSDRERGLLVWFSALGPLVGYQFWSAHPDSLFAALYLAAVCLTHALVQRPTIGKAALLAVTILCSLLLKNYGLVLLPGCALYLVWHWRSFTARGPAIAAALGLLAVAVLVVLGFTGHNPFMRVEGEGGGAGQYGQGSWLRSSRGTLTQLLLTLALNLQIVLPFALWPMLRNAAPPDPGRARLLPLIVCFPLPYVLGLLPFPNAFYNMRYFLPVVPFVALLALAGLRRTRATVQRLVPVAFTAVFNVAPLHALASPCIPALEVDWIGPRLSLLDNLRMPRHRQQAQVLDHLNTNIEPGAVLYLLDVNYYGDAQRGVYERGGRIRGDISTRYVSSRGLRPEEPRCYVFGRVRDLDRLRQLGQLTDLGQDLYRLDR